MTFTEKVSKMPVKGMAPKRTATSINAPVATWKKFQALCRKNNVSPSRVLSKFMMEELK